MNKYLSIDFQLPEPFNRLQPFLPTSTQKSSSGLCGYFSVSFLLHGMLLNPQEFHFQQVSDGYEKFITCKEHTQIIMNTSDVQKKLRESVIGYFDENIYQQWEQNFCYLISSQNIIDPTQTSQNGGNILEAYIRLFINQMHTRQSGFFLHDVGFEWYSIWDFLINSTFNTGIYLRQTYYQRLIDFQPKIPQYKIEWLVVSLVVQIHLQKSNNPPQSHVIGAMVHIPSQKIILLDQMAISIAREEDSFLIENMIFQDFFKGQEDVLYKDVFNSETGFSYETYDLFSLGEFITNFSIWIPVDIRPYDTMFMDSSLKQSNQNSVEIPIKDPRQIENVKNYELIQASYQMEQKNIIGNIAQTSKGILTNNENQIVSSLNQNQDCDSEGFNKYLILGIRPKRKTTRTQQKAVEVERILKSEYNNDIEDIILGIENSQVCTDHLLVNRFLEKAQKINEQIQKELNLSDEVEVVMIRDETDSWQLMFYILSDPIYVQFLQ